MLHDWRYIHDWCGDPGVIGGTADCSFLRCTTCGAEEEPDGDPEDYYEDDYYDEP